MQSDREIDALLFRDLDDLPGSGELRRILAEVEPEHWGLLRETVRRTLDERDEVRRAALLKRVVEVEAAARQRAHSRVATAPISALDTLDRVATDLLRILAHRDSATCVAWRWPDQAPAEKRIEALPRSLLLATEIETLRAARAGRRMPTAHRRLDDGMAARLRELSKADGFTAAEIEANDAAERPAGWSDADLCALILRMKAADARLPDDLRAAVLIQNYPAHQDDPIGRAAERLARIPGMSDTEIDTMMFAERSEIPGAGPALALLAEVMPGAWPGLRRVLRETFRPIDEGEAAGFPATVAFMLATREMDRLALAPAWALEALGRSARDASLALGRLRPRLCGRPGRPWHGFEDPAEIAAAIPVEAVRFAQDSALALKGSAGAPATRSLDDPALSAALQKALDASGYRPPNAGAAFGDPVRRPPDREGGYCKWHGDYLTALLGLPDDLRAFGLASYLSQAGR